MRNRGLRKYLPNAPCLTIISRETKKLQPKKARTAFRGTRMKILTVNNEREEKFLRTKVGDFDFAGADKKELGGVVKEMRKTMREAEGVGLSANQVGLNARLFIAQISDEPPIRGKDGEIILPSEESMKFYAIFNPEIVKFSKKRVVMEEGCLSVPGIYGPVERPEKITLVGLDENGKKIKIQAAGLTARVFQHETDHLNGILFTDKALSLEKAG